MASVPDVPWPVTTEGIDEARVEAQGRGSAGVVARPGDGVGRMSRGMADEARAAIDVMLEQEWDERFDRPQIERIIEALRREARAIQ